MAHIKKRADGRYQRKITLSDGKAKVVYGRTLAELKEKEDIVRLEDNQGILIGDKTTVSEWVEKWFSVYKKDVREKTKIMYRYVIDSFITPNIGNIALKEVKPVDCQNVMSLISDKSESTQGKVRSCMNQVFAEAVRNGLILKNPSEGLKLVKHPEREKITAVSDADVSVILSRLEDARAKALVGLAYYCGLRREECLGLKWEDIQENSLTVRRSLSFPTGHLPEISTALKTRTSHRTVPIPKAMQKLLNDVPKSSEWVIYPLRAELMTKSGYTYIWKKVEAVSPVPIHIHQLRHSYCTSLYHAGIDLRVAQILLGHSSIMVTANIYTHISEKESVNQYDKLNEYFDNLK